MNLTMTSLRRQVAVITALTLGQGFFALQQLSGRDDGDGGIPRWFIRETPIKIDDLGVPPSLGNFKTWDHQTWVQDMSAPIILLYLGA